jgi:hypothetical protein
MESSFPSKPSMMAGVAPSDLPPETAPPNWKFKKREIGVHCLDEGSVNIVPNSAENKGLNDDPMTTTTGNTAHSTPFFRQESRIGYRSGS